MIKLIICLTLTQISVECCSKSEPEHLRPPAVPGFIPSALCAYEFFKDYKKSGNFMSELPDDRRIRELSIVGTRESISHLLVDDSNNNKRQEINIMTQLNSGVRFLDITLHVDSGIIMVSIGDTFIDKTFGEFIFDVNLFLSYHRLELVIIKLKHMFNYDTSLVCDLINKYQENNNGGFRLVTDWGLNDTLGMHRGKILLASEDGLLKNCTFSLKTCSRFNNINYDEINSDNLDIYLDHEWTDYLKMVKNSFNDEYQCNVYDLSVKSNYFPIKNVSKYGGYHTGVVNSAECVKPINFKLWKHYPESNPKEFNVIMMDYVMQEVIDRVNQENYKYKLIDKNTSQVIGLKDIQVPS